MRRLFSPFQIGNLALKNRIVIPAMHLGYAENGFVDDRLIRFYQDRAKGGAGLIIVGGAYVHHLGTGGLNFMAIDGDKYIPGLKALNKAMKDAGAKTSIQLFHSGRYAHSILTGEQPVSASDVRSPISGDTPRVLSIEEIKDIVHCFTLAAKRAVAAGYDSVEISGATGYLISQFLSPFTNKRNDEYGGNFINRLRFAKEIIENIKQALGSDYPVIFRLTFHDLVKGGNSLDESMEIAKELEKTGIDLLEMQVGWHESKVPTSAMLVPRAAFAYLSREIKKVISMPVMVTNRINDPVLADELLQDNVADLIGMARPLIADPDLPNKAMKGKNDEIRPCIACNQGCMDTIFSGRPSTCLVNPAAGNEAIFEIKPAVKFKKVVIVGAGPAGLEAAGVLSIRGHDVTVYEKEDNIGGQLNLCGIAPDRGEFKAYLNYLKAYTKRLDIKTGKEATAQMIMAESPDVVILATGAKQILPDIQGIKRPNVFTGASVLKKEADLGEKIVIIGGGHIGCDTALFIAQRCFMSLETACFLVDNDTLTWEEAMAYRKRIRSVTIVEQRKKIAAFYGRTSRWSIMQGLHKKNVKMMTRTKCIGIDDRSIIVEMAGERQSIEADTIVITSGYVSENRLYERLNGKISELFIIGDAKKTISCQKAIYDALKLSNEI